MPDALRSVCAAQGVVDDGVALLIFEAENCLACRRMAPTVASLQADFPNRLCVLSVAAHRSLAMSLRIMATPTVVLIADQRVAEVFVGITPKDVLAKALERQVGARRAIA